MTVLADHKTINAVRNMLASGISEAEISETLSIPPKKLQRIVRGYAGKRRPVSVPRPPIHKLMGGR